MGARFLILLAVAGGMAVFLAMRPKAPAPGAATASGETVAENDDGMSDAERADVEVRKTDLWKIPLPGAEPAVPPEFAVVADVNLASGKNQLCFDISEAHGYFVETLTLEYWYTGPDGTDTRENSRFVWQETVNDFIEANKTLRWCLEIVPAEMKMIGGSLGTAMNWKGAIIHHNRARTENPNPLPEHPARLPKNRTPIQTGRAPGQGG